MNDFYKDIPKMNFVKIDYYLQDHCKKFRFDLDKKRNGTFRLVFVNVKNVQSFVRYIEAAEFRYGPVESVIQTRLKLTAEVVDERIICQSQTVIAAKFILAAIDREILADANILEASFIEKLYAYENRGSFVCSDEMLNKIYRGAVETIHMCTMPHHETYIARNQANTERAQRMLSWKKGENDFVLLDGPRRDREAWVGDLLPEFRTSWYAFGDKQVLKNSLLVFADQQEKNGFLPASSVSYQDFKEYNCWFLIVLYEYVLLTGDIEFARELRGCYTQVLNYLIRLLDENGLLNLGKMQTWAWTLSRTGNITSSQCVLVRCMECTALLERLQGYAESAVIYDNIAVKTKKMVNGLAWDGIKGAYRNVASSSCNSYSLDANALAVMFKIADSKKQISVLDFIKGNMSCSYGTYNLYPQEAPKGNNWCHNKHIWPFAVNFEVDARFSAGDYTGAVDLIKRCWGTMINQGSHTFWEFIDGSNGTFVTDIMQNLEVEGDFWNSYCHGWSAGVGYSIVANIAGIKPLSAGFKQFEIVFQDNAPKEFHATVPTESGEISIDKSNSEASVKVPEDTSCTINVEGRKRKLTGGKYNIQLTI